MDYSQFMRLMDEHGYGGKESVQLLQEYVNEFPYFQTAQILLARAMHEQQHVRYEKQLKLASAYSGDRKILYNLIHPRPATLFSDKVHTTESSFINDSMQGTDRAEDIFSEGKPLLPPVENIPIPKDEEPGSEIKFTPVVPLFIEEEEHLDTEADIDDGPPVADPHEIIRRRLNEILGLKDSDHEFKPVQSEKISVEEVPVKEKPAETQSMTIKEELPFDEKGNKVDDAVELTVSGKDIIHKIAEESSKAKDVIDKGELEYALEASLVEQLEKLPVIKTEPPVEKIVISEVEKEELKPEEIKAPLSFYDWLKQKKLTGYGVVEEVHAYEEPVPEAKTVAPIHEEETEKKNADKNELIDRFIRTEPKIVPSRAEFFSPSAQAKKSITEDEDLVSETLANIFRQQGNLLKARSSYHKLSLLFPEKMAYFAALISEIDKEINNLQKKENEDL